MDANGRQVAVSTADGSRLRPSFEHMNLQERVLFVAALHETLDEILIEIRSVVGTGSDCCI